MQPPWGAGAQAHQYLDGLLPRLDGNTKPIVFGAMSDGQGLPPDIGGRIFGAHLAYIPSPERALRAMARLTAYGRRVAKLDVASPAAPYSGLPKLGTGVQPEWLGKKVLATIGIQVPDGALVQSLEEALAAAVRIGYPVVIKAQAAALAHKTEAGGVIVGIASAGELERAWSQLHANVRKARPDLELEGVLVEKAAPRGLELMVGARRDPDWGPIVMIGLGGIWVEAIGDVRIFPADLAIERIAEEFDLLKSAKLLRGFRGQPPLDVAAAAEVAARIGRLTVTRPDIQEIDVNPLVLYPRGAVALDALVVTKQQL